MTPLYFLAIGLILLALALGTVTISSQYVSQLTVTRTFSGGDVSPANNTIDVNQLNTSETLNAGSTPAASMDFDALLTMTAGAVTMDLTAIVDLLGRGTVTLTGLTPAHFKFVNPSTNGNAITITHGAANGYTGFGALFVVTLPPGGEIMIRLGAIVVDGTHKTLDITGTGSQALKVQGTAG